MSTFQERLEAKRERFALLATKNKEASVSRFAQAHQMADLIPFGQPILIGHHSEGRHRRDLTKIHSNFGKGIELEKKAEYYEEKAENYGTHGISSENPDALPMLKLKLAKQEQEHEKMIQINKRSRAEGTEKLPAYMLSNSNGRMKATRDRIALMEKMEARPAQKLERDGYTYEENKEEGRIMFTFPAIPSEEKRTLLKRNGYKWSPSRGAWVRMLTPNALHATRRMIPLLEQK